MSFRSTLNSRLTLWRCAWLFACAALGLSPSALAEEQYSGPGVVLLKNDRFQTGIIHQSAGKVQIELDARSSVTHSAHDIAFIGRDLEAVYQYKLRRYARLGIGEHFQLTRWCMSVGLIDHATEHFLHVNRVKAEEPRVKQLGVELREKMLNDGAFREFLGLTPLRNESLPAQENTFSVQVAGASQVVSDHPLVLSQFTQRVQPILINRCSQSACHGFSSDNRLKLIEPKGRAYARISSENLKRVLQFVETSPSLVSTLVRKATEAHSLQKTPGIGASEPELIDTLHDWAVFASNPVVTAVAVQNPSDNALGFTHSVEPPPKLVPVGPGNANLRTVPQAGLGRAQQIQGFQPPSASEIDKLDDELRKILGEPPRPAQTHRNPTDPFDPAEFNQQVGRSASAALNR